MKTATPSSTRKASAGTYESRKTPRTVPTAMVTTSPVMNGPLCTLRTVRHMINPAMRSRKVLATMIDCGAKNRAPTGMKISAGPNPVSPLMKKAAAAIAGRIRKK